MDANSGLVGVVTAAMSVNGSIVFLQIRLLASHVSNHFNPTKFQKFSRAGSIIIPACRNSCELKMSTMKSVPHKKARGLPIKALFIFFLHKTKVPNLTDAFVKIQSLNHAHETINCHI